MTNITSCSKAGHWAPPPTFVSPRELPRAPTLIPKSVKEGVIDPNCFWFWFFRLDFWVLSRHNKRMAKYISGAKLTVETPTERYEFDAPAVSVSSITMGRTHELYAPNLLNMVKHDLTTPKETPVPEEPKTPETGLTHEQEAGLNAVLQTAKSIERTQFVSARAVERVVLEAEQTKAVVQHDFNMAVLEALHAGLTQEQIEKHLFDAGFSQLEEKVDTIHMLDTVLLYSTEA